MQSDYIFQSPELPPHQFNLSTPAPIQSIPSPMSHFNVQSHTQSRPTLPSLAALLAPKPIQPTTPPTQSSHFGLQSPPTPTTMSFSHRREMAKALLTPPASAEQALLHSFSSHKDDGSQDPQLYSPDTPATQVADNIPLFATESEASVEADISRHIADTSEQFQRAQVSRPKPEDYRAVAQVFRQIKLMGVKTYMQQEEDWMARVGRKENPKRILFDGSLNRRQLKPLAPKASSEARRHIRPSTAPRSPRAPRAHNKVARAVYNGEDGALQVPRAKVIKPKEEFKYDHLPDYAPKFNTERELQNGMYHANQMRWTGANSQSDLTNDPDVHHLSAPEVIVASKLRLTGAKYLSQKRKIFMHVIEILRQGKEFKKTNCQDVRMIDVNKLSTLWVFYNAVGWFDRVHYAGML